MKLDKRVIENIISKIHELKIYEYSDYWDNLEEVLKDLELFFSPNDSSQSVLVDQDTLRKEWSDIYGKQD